MKMWLGRAIVLATITIFLAACSSKKTQNQLGDVLQVPNSDFKIRTLADFHATTTDDILLISHLSIDDAPTFLISGRKFNVYEPKEIWLEQRFSGLELSDLEEITINGISGYVASYEGEDPKTDLITAWVAALATEDEGLVIYVKSSPDQVQEIRSSLFSMLESVTITSDE